VVQVLAGTLGRGPTSTEVVRLGDDGLVVLMRGGYLPAEQTLTRAGRKREVERSRRQLQRAMDPELRAVVSELTGRRVERVLSAFDARSELSAEIFLFEPLAPQTGD
jgi:uncharacterized protein YbcI